MKYWPSWIDNSLKAAVLTALLNGVSVCIGSAQVLDDSPDNILVHDTIQTTVPSGPYSPGVRVTEDGELQFDKLDGGASQTYLRILPHQRNQGNIPFTIRAGSHLNTGSLRNNDVTIIGYGVNGGGGSQNPSVPGFALSFENHYEPSPGVDMKEFHLLHVDKQGIQRRPLSLILDSDDPASWYGYNSVSRYFWSDPTNSGAYASFFRDGTSGSNLRLMGSATDRGAIFYVNSASNTLQLVNSGMINPDIYATTFRNLHVNGLRVVSGHGTPPVVVTGRDQQGYLTDVPLAPNLTITEDGVLTSRSSTDTVSLQFVVQDWNSEVTTGRELRINVPMQYQNYRLVEVWCFHSVPGNGGSTTVQLQNITAEHPLTTVVMESALRSNNVLTLDERLHGGDEISVRVTKNADVPAKGLRAVLVLVK